MFTHLKQRGKRYGMVFHDRDRSSNSHSALLAGEFAQDMGHFDEFHKNVFKAFFTDHKDINKVDIILNIASISGLDQESLKLALQEGRYEGRLNTAATEARRLGIRSIPAFVFENDEIILGALSPDVFLKTLESIQDGTYITPYL